MTTNAVQDHLKAGELDEAIGLMNAEIRANPKDTNRRAVLVELLCFAGNLERADTVLDAISTVDPGAAVGVAMVRQLVRAEQARQQFYSDGRVPEFVKKPGGAMELELRAAIAQREGASAEAASLLAEAEAIRLRAPGTLDGVAFDDFRDLDDLSAAHFEVLTATGKYYWIPVESITSLEFRPPGRRRDLLWRRAAMAVTEGPDGEVFIPAIYPFRGAAATPRHRLGYATDFLGEETGPKFEIGLRTLLVGEEGRTILELGKLEFVKAAS